MNETLSQRGFHVDDISQLADGVHLAQFFEILSQKKIQTKIEPKPVNRIMKIQNCAIALKFLETDLGLRNPGCSAEDVVDIETRGIKLILGLLWILYRKYRIAVITHQDKSSEEGLLLWCKNVTEGYAGVNIENFKQSFKDGLAFLALVHRYNPETSAVAFDKYSKDTPEQNLSAAFEFAEKELHIPKLLDVHEVMDGRVDERSLVLYTSLFFHAYTAAQVANDLEKARLSTEEVLAVERKKNEDLHRLNSELGEQIEQLKFQLQEKDSKLEERETVQLEFQTKVTDLKLNLTEYSSKITELESKIEKLNLIISEKEEISLAAAAAYKKLEEKYEELSLQLSTHAEESVTLKSAAEKKQIEDEHHILELKKKHTLFEEEIESLKNDIDNFKIQLDNERKDKEDQQRVLNERTQQDGVHRNGLGVLRRNLDQHIEDLHTWQKYLDSKDKTFLDFDYEIRSGLLAELDGASDFVGELNILSGKLDAENEAMLKILKNKLADAKQAEIAKVGSK